MKQIMLVDDESDLRLSIKIALDNLYKNEFSVISAENGEKCINILKQGTIPDIILLDIMMPNMSGWEVYDKIRDNPDWKNITGIEVKLSWENSSNITMNIDGLYFRIFSTSIERGTIIIDFVRNHIKRRLKKNCRDFNCIM